jgi:hypothetical protein
VDLIRWSRHPGRGRCALLVFLGLRAARVFGRGSTCIVAAEKKQKMMWEALREAIDEEMEADPNVLVMGACRTLPLLPRDYRRGKQK